MKVLKISGIVKANIDIRVLNMISHYMWYNRDIKEHFNDLMEYQERELSLYCIEKDMTMEEIKKYHIDYIYNLRNDSCFKKFIKELKEQEIKVVSEKELLKIHGLDDYFNSWKDIQSFITNTLYKELA